MCGCRAGPRGAAGGPPEADLAPEGTRDSRGPCGAGLACPGCSGCASPSTGRFLMRWFEMKSCGVHQTPSSARGRGRGGGTGRSRCHRRRRALEVRSGQSLRAGTPPWAARPPLEAVRFIVGPSLFVVTLSRHRFQSHVNPGPLRIECGDEMELPIPRHKARASHGDPGGDTAVPEAPLRKDSGGAGLCPAKAGGFQSPLAPWP